MKQDGYQIVSEIVSKQAIRHSLKKVGKDIRRGTHPVDTLFKKYRAGRIKGIGRKKRLQRDLADYLKDRPLGKPLKDKDVIKALQTA